MAGAVSEEELDAWHRWWRAEVADGAPQQLTAGSGAGEAELVVRGEDPDGLPGTPFGQPLSDGFRHLVALARPGEIDQDAVGADVLVPPITDRWDAVLDRAAGGWWGQLMKAIRSHARGDLEEARLGYLRSAHLTSTPGQPAVWRCSPVAGAIIRAPRTCTPAPSLKRRPACHC